MGALGLSVGGDMTQLADSTLSMAFAGSQTAPIAVNGAMMIAGGVLELKSVAGEAAPAGEAVKLITAASVSGTFDAVRLDGATVEVRYGDTGISIVPTR